MYLPNFLDSFDRLVAFDAETTGKHSYGNVVYPAAQEIASICGGFEPVTSAAR